MSECPCRRCASLRSGWGYGWFMSCHSDAEQIADAKRRFVSERPDWRAQPWLYTVEWLEAEIDAILGVTHARHETQTLRELSS